MYAVLFKNMRLTRSRTHQISLSKKRPYKLSEQLSLPFIYVHGQMATSSGCCNNEGRKRGSRVTNKQTLTQQNYVVLIETNNLFLNLTKSFCCLNSTK